MSQDELQNETLTRLLKEALSRVKELEEAIKIVHDGLQDANEDPYVRGEETVLDVLSSVMKHSEPDMKEALTQASKMFDSWPQWKKGSVKDWFEKNDECEDV